MDSICNTNDERVRNMWVVGVAECGSKHVGTGIYVLSVTVMEVGVGVGGWRTEGGTNCCSRGTLLHGPGSVLTKVWDGMDPSCRVQWTRQRYVTVSTAGGHWMDGVGGRPVKDGGGKVCA